MVIYADILFAINFSMDFIALFITGALSRRKVNKKFILISSAIGGLYGVFQVICTLNTVISLIVNLTVSFLMCFFAYYDGKIRRILPKYIIFLGVSAALAGFMSVFYSFLNSILAEYIKDYSYTSVYNGARFFIIASLAVILSLVFGRIFSKERSIESVNMEVILKGDKFKLMALCDSGNLLKDPFSGRSVILISKECKLGEKIENIPDIYKRYIPFKAMNSNGIVKGVIPEEITVNGCKLDAVIASVENKSFAGYEGCIPSCII